MQGALSLRAQSCICIEYITKSEPLIKVFLAQRFLISLPSCIRRYMPDPKFQGAFNTTLKEKIDKFSYGKHLEKKSFSAVLSLCTSFLTILKYITSMYVILCIYYVCCRIHIHNAPNFLKILLCGLLFCPISKWDGPHFPMILRWRPVLNWDEAGASNGSFSYFCRKFGAVCSMPSYAIQNLNE